MNTVKILHCADIHIGAPISFLHMKAPLRQSEILLNFEKIIDLCKVESVKLLLIAGDLFDSNSVSKELSNKVFRKIAENPELKVVYVAGNHDPLNMLSPFVKIQLPKNLFVLPTHDSVVTFEDLKVKVYGRSFETAFMKSEERFLLPVDEEYINILLQHGELNADENSQYNAISKDFLKNSGMDYVALGHIHQRTEISKIGETYFSYCGSPEGQGFDETNEKGVYIGEIGKDFCDLKFVKTGKRQHILFKMDITGIHEHQITENILNSLQISYGENYAENLYKIELIGNINPDEEINISEIISRLNETLFFAKVIASFKPKIDFEQLAQEKSLKGIFVKTMLEKIDNAVTDQEKKICIMALNNGLKAFSSEVIMDEN